MKKTSIVLISLVIMISLGGCMVDKEKRFTTIRYDNGKLADHIMQMIVDALDAKDADALEKLFSAPALEETEGLEQQIEAFMDFYRGDVVSYEGDAQVDTSYNQGDTTQEFIGQYKVVTTEETYRIAYDHKPVDDKNPKDEGLYKLEIVTEAEYQKQLKSEAGYYDWKHYDYGPGVYFPDAD